VGLTVNGESVEWREGLTVEALLEERKFSFPLKTVFVNGRRIPRTEQAATRLADGDVVEVVHLMSGG
jgi:sulfur carrier protein